MRSLFIALGILFLLHAASAGAGIGWLATTGRLDRERVLAVVEMFRDPVEDDEQDAANAADQGDPLARAIAWPDPDADAETAREVVDERRRTASRELERLAAAIDAARRASGAAADDGSDDGAASNDADPAGPDPDELLPAMTVEQQKARLAALLAEGNEAGIRRLLLALGPRDRKKLFAAHRDEVEVRRLMTLLDRLERDETNDADDEGGDA